LHLLGDVILRPSGGWRAYNGRWERGFTFVHRNGLAKRLTVILAKEADTVVLLNASGKAGVAENPEVDVAAGLKFVASSRAVTQSTGAPNIARSTTRTE
jgi:hypothetical protein